MDTLLSGVSTDSLFWASPVANKNQIMNTTPVSGDVQNDPCFNASKSSPIYGNSNTVQPPAMTLIPQIKY
jgi:hypothetical protein